jgi:hypothetical protein
MFEGATFGVEVGQLVFALLYSLPKFQYFVPVVLHALLHITLLWRRLRLLASIGQVR